MIAVTDETAQRDGRARFLLSREGDIIVRGLVFAISQMWQTRPVSQLVRTPS